MSQMLAGTVCGMDCVEGAVEAQWVRNCATD